VKSDPLPGTLVTVTSPLIMRASLRVTQAPGRCRRNAAPSRRRYIWGMHHSIGFALVIVRDPNTRELGTSGLSRPPSPRTIGSAYTEWD
jgi:hypothetical protein